MSLLSSIIQEYKVKRDFPLSFNFVASIVTKQKASALDDYLFI